MVSTISLPASARNDALVDKKQKWLCAPLQKKMLFYPLQSQNWAKKVSMLDWAKQWISNKRLRFSKGAPYFCSFPGRWRNAAHQVNKDTLLPMSRSSAAARWKKERRQGGAALFLDSPY